ncbi:MAG: methyltransferase domain-containing protein [Pseudonocardiaceae bacterium]
MSPISANPDDAALWLEAVYSNKTLVTQITPTDVTSSGTMPGLLAKMLTTIRINTGDNALHVGTGTGYTAALLCERPGANKVTTVDIDPDLSNHAHTRLDHIGYTPTVVTGNGAQGYPPNAPYDAILATCALRRIPADWLAQAAPGARILAPWPQTRSRTLQTHRPRKKPDNLARRTTRRTDLALAQLDHTLSACRLRRGTNGGEFIRSVFFGESKPGAVPPRRRVRAARTYAATPACAPRTGLPALVLSPRRCFARRW